MPPSSNPPQPVDPGHMLPPHPGRTGPGRTGKKSGMGATFGIIIILVLVLFGALYFWGAYLNRKNSVPELPFIPEQNSTGQTG